MSSENLPPRHKPNKHMTSEPTGDIGPDAYTVSEITANIKHLLEDNFPFIWINGEISNFSSPLSGHYYFALKDEKAQVAAVMFKGQQRKLEFVPEDGMSIRALGRITVYEPRGTYQVIVEHMLPVGAGALLAAFEQLKRKLSLEGLFDDRWKKRLPGLPSAIKLITSPTGAAFHDVMHVISRRFPGLKVVQFPVQVQGDAAADEISSAIAEADQNDATEIIILSRGGGTFEDLAPFNTESVARAVFECNTPVVTGIGHQTDFSIADLVADHRAPTPSAAAEIAVPEKETLRENVARLKTALKVAALSLIHQRRSELQHHLKNVSHPKAQLQHKRLEIDHLSNRLVGAFQVSLQLKTEKIHQIKKYININKLDKYIINNKHMVEEKKVALAHTIVRILEQQKTDLLLLSTRLAGTNPATVLKRGYSIARAVPSNAIITDASAISAGQKVSITLAKGSIMAKVTQILKRN
jgi:exodeoxyribonuclease VII large subunit